jgi:hypothetical protein
MKDSQKIHVYDLPNTIEASSFIVEVVHEVCLHINSVYLYSINLLVVHCKEQSYFTSSSTKDLRKNQLRRYLCEHAKQEVELNIFPAKVLSISSGVQSSFRL